MFRGYVLLSAAILLLQGAAASAQNDFERGLEKFYSSRNILGAFEVSKEGISLGSRCRSQLDELAPHIRKVSKDHMLIRIESYGGNDTDVSVPLAVAKQVHDYLRDRHKIDVTLYLTGYAGGNDRVVRDRLRVEVVSYEGILPVDDAEIETVIIR